MYKLDLKRCVRMQSRADVKVRPNTEYHYRIIVDLPFQRLEILIDPDYEDNEEIHIQLTERGGKQL